MGLLDRIRRALDKQDLAKLKKKINRLDNETTKHGKTVKSLTIVLRPRSDSLSVFEFVLSDGTTCINTKKLTNRVTPIVGEGPIDDQPSKKASKLTLVGRSSDYDEKSTWVEEYEPRGVKVFPVVRRDGVTDILKLKFRDTTSVPRNGNTIWWIENQEKVCKRFNVTATRPPEALVISLRAH